MKTDLEYLKQDIVACIDEIEDGLFDSEDKMESIIPPSARAMRIAVAQSMSMRFVGNILNRLRELVEDGDAAKVKRFMKFHILQLKPAVHYGAKDLTSITIALTHDVLSKLYALHCES